MKWLSIYFLFIYTAAFSQQTHWRVEYMVLKYKTPEQKQRWDSISKSNGYNFKKISRNKEFYKSLYRQTYFLDLNKEASLYTHKPKMIRMAGEYRRYFNSDEIYKNLKNNEIITTTSLFDTSYLIKDTLPVFHWKITGETKKIGRYTAIKAVGTEKIWKKKVRMPDLSGKKNIKPAVKSKMVNSEVTAWFTPEIPISNGPEKYGGLPGLILELHIPGKIYMAKKISINPRRKKEIKAPIEGTYITRKVLRKKRDSLELIMIKSLINHRKKE